MYILFTVICNALLFSGFRTKAIFFDTFIGAFFWLGFWLKLTIRVAFMQSGFREDVGNFDHSGIAFDRGLLVTCIGLAPILLASALRERFGFFYPPKLEKTISDGASHFYIQNRTKLLIGFAVLVILITTTNYYFGIYQRGELPRTIPPFGLRGVYTWLLLFGLASFSALILDSEFSQKKKTSYVVVILVLLESFLTSVSMLSRGMVLNSGALVYGVIRTLKPKSIRSSFHYFGGWLVIFTLLFAVSIVAVQHLRSISDKSALNVEESILSSPEKAELKKDPGVIDPVSIGQEAAPILFLDRWVGIEGVLAVSSYPQLGWNLWNEAWREVYKPQMSFYDANLVTSTYRETDMTKHHYIALPGIVAFCFYPGSYAFLFVCMFVLAWIAVCIEIVAFKLGGGNLILCALLGQVVAYRYMHYGYVPSQSYLLFGSIFLNLFLIYTARNLISRRSIGVLRE